MKDKNLEQQFDEYFQGVNTPENITCDAKKYVVKKQSALPKFVKFASVAASFLIVFVSALAVILHLNGANSLPEAPDASLPEAPDASAPSDEDESAYSFYTDENLSSVSADAYVISELDPALKFIENFAYSSNAIVNVCETGYGNGQLTLVKATVNMLDGLNRSDAEIYVEYTEENLIYYPLEQFVYGNEKSYNGVPYRITEGTAENGEPEFKLYFTYGGLKYYFNITSTDENSYLKYLEMIIK